MIPTEDNITEVARARIRAIRSRAVDLGDNESTDERLLGITIREAIRLAARPHHAPATAQAAVAWAIANMYAIDVEGDVAV